MEDSKLKMPSRLKRRETVFKALEALSTKIGPFDGKTRAELIAMLADELPALEFKDQKKSEAKGVMFTPDANDVKAQINNLERCGKIKIAPIYDSASKTTAGLRLTILC